MCPSKVTIIEPSEDTPELTDFEKGFLIGIIEGEGFIGLAKQRGPNNRTVPLIGLASTDKDLVEYLASIYKKLGISYVLMAKRHYAHPEWKDYYDIRVPNYKNVKRLFPILESGLVSEHRRTQLRQVETRLAELESKRRFYDGRPVKIANELNDGKAPKTVAASLGVGRTHIYHILHTGGFSLSDGLWKRDPNVGQP